MSNHHKIQVLVMNNKLTLFAIFLIVPLLAFAEHNYSGYYNWLFTAYLYNLKLWTICLIGFIIIYLLLLKRSKPIVNNLRDYLVHHPSLSIIACSVPSLILLGLWLRYSILPQFEIFDFNIFGLLALLVGASSILVVNRWFRNNILLSPQYLTSVYLLVLSAICARFLLIIMSNKGLLQFSSPTYSDSIWGYKSHPYDSAAYMWYPATKFLYITLLSLIILLIRNGYRWAKNRWKEKKI